MLQLLDGLPLAIAQAGAYLEQSGMRLSEYIHHYKLRWDELVEPRDTTDTPLMDYPNRSVWTTWTISYQAIRDRHEPTANLLLLWSFLENKDLWHELFAVACEASETASVMLLDWIGNIATSEIKFVNAMALLCDYSLVEQIQETASYAMHAVVHYWAFHSQGKHLAMKLYRLAVVTVGLAIPNDTAYFSSAMQRRILPHVQTCFQWIVECEQKWVREFKMACKVVLEKHQRHEALLEALHRIGLLFVNQGKQWEAKLVYDCALKGQEAVLGPEHSSTLTTINDLGVLYQDQQQLDMAEEMYKRALKRRAAKFGPNGSPTLATVNNLASLFLEQGKPAHAERMYKWALKGKEEELGPNHLSTLHTVNNLGAFYAGQGELSDAQQMFERVLQGYDTALCENHNHQYLPAFDALENAGNLYVMQGEHYKACLAFLKALIGLQGHLDHSSDRCLQLIHKITNLSLQQADRQEHTPS